MTAATASGLVLIECECCGERFPTKAAAEGHADWPDYCGFTAAELVEVEV